MRVQYSTYTSEDFQRIAAEDDRFRLLTEKQRSHVNAAIECKTVKEVANRLGCSSATVIQTLLVVNRHYYLRQRNPSYRPKAIAGQASTNPDATYSAHALAKHLGATAAEIYKLVEDKFIAVNRRERQGTYADDIQIPHSQIPVAATLLLIRHTNKLNKEQAIISNLRMHAEDWEYE